MPATCLATSLYCLTGCVQSDRNPAALDHMEPSTILVGRLLEAGCVPPGTSSDCLVLARYEVLHVEAGTEPSSGRVLVYHWAARNGKPTQAANLEPGDCQRLELTPMEEAKHLLPARRIIPPTLERAAQSGAPWVCLRREEALAIPLTE